MAQNDAGWHISPILFNLVVGDVQPLQILDVRGKELSASSWSVDNSQLAEIREEHGHPVLYPKSAGIVHVVALVEHVTLTREITIWSLEPGMQLVGPFWAVPSTGREIGAIQAVPTPDSPDFITLDQNDNGTYVRGLTNRGQQMWMVKLPEAAGEMKLLCGDNFGGAIVIATRPESYTVFVVNKAGKVSWQRKFDGVRKGYAFNAANLLHLITESVDGTSAIVSAWDGSTGVERFTLRVPKSYEQEVNIRRSSDKLFCAPGGNVSRPLRTATSGLFVSTDGNAYASFVQKRWNVEAKKCEAGANVSADTVAFSRDDQLVLWQIHPDGSIRTSVVETSKQPRLSLTSHFRELSPTGSIMPDGSGGVLFSIRTSPTSATGSSEGPSDEFVYRVTGDGELAYKFRLPKYTGALHDDMVLGEQELAFAARGSMLLAFNARDGKEVWRWDSGKPDIEVNMATAGGGCVVSTLDGLVLVEDGLKSQIIAPRGSDMYTGGRFIQDDPHGFAMLGAGVVKH